MQAPLLHAAPPRPRIPPRFAGGQHPALGALPWQVQTADIAELLAVLRRALDTLADLNVGTDAGMIAEWERTVWRDLLAMFMWTPNPRSNPGPATVPVSAPIGAGDYVVDIDYSKLWFRRPPAEWLIAIAAHLDPLGQVVFGRAVALNPHHVAESEGQDDAAQIARLHADALGAASRERARVRAARQSAEVLFTARRSVTTVARLMSPVGLPQYMQGQLASVLPAERRRWIELNVCLTARACASYQYYIRPAGLRQHDLNHNPRGPFVSLLPCTPSVASFSPAPETGPDLGARCVVTVVPVEGCSVGRNRSELWGGYPRRRWRWTELRVLHATNRLRPPV